MAETDKGPVEENRNPIRGPCVYGNLAYDNDDHVAYSAADVGKTDSLKGKKNKVGSQPQTMYHNKLLMD